MRFTPSLNAFRRRTLLVMGLVLVLGAGLAATTKRARLREGEVLSVVMGGGSVKVYGVLKVVSTEGDGCCILLEDELRTRPIIVSGAVPLGRVPLADIVDVWRDCEPRRLGHEPVTDAERRYCGGVPEEPSLGCKTPLKEGLDLSAGDRCRIELLRGRCGPGDDCLVACMARGADRIGADMLIAGGCWHVCGLADWSPPEEFDACGR